MHVRARDPLDDQLHQTVVEEQPVPGLHHRGQLGETHRDAFTGADHLLAGQDETVARLQLDRFGIDLPQPHLRSGQVRHDGHPPAGGLFGGTDPRDAFGVAAEIAVRKIEPRHIQPGANQPFQHRR